MHASLSRAVYRAMGAITTKKKWGVFIKSYLKPCFYRDPLTTLTFFLEIIIPMDAKLTGLHGPCSKLLYYKTVVKIMMFNFINVLTCFFIARCCREPALSSIAVIQRLAALVLFRSGFTLTTLLFYIK